MAMGSDTLAAFRGLSPADWQWLERLVFNNHGPESDAWRRALEKVRADLAKEQKG
jgi:hypothetical protein